MDLPSPLRDATPSGVARAFCTWCMGAPAPGAPTPSKCCAGLGCAPLRLVEHGALAGVGLSAAAAQVLQWHFVAHPPPEQRLHSAKLRGGGASCWALRVPLPPGRFAPRAAAPMHLPKWHLWPHPLHSHHQAEWSPCGKAGGSTTMLLPLPPLPILLPTHSSSCLFASACTLRASSYCLFAKFFCSKFIENKLRSVDWIVSWTIPTCYTTLSFCCSHGKQFVWNDESWLKKLSINRKSRLERHGEAWCLCS